MILNSFRLISLLLNAALIFFTIAFIVEGIIGLFQIKNPRSRATLRVMPFLGMIVDRIFTEFNLVNWLNPLGCCSCTQKIILKAFFPGFNHYLESNDISLMTYLSKSTSEVASMIIFTLFCSITFFIFSYKVCRAFFHKRLLNEIISNGEPCNHEVDNAKLQFGLKRNQVNVCLSDQILIPLATYSNSIIIPRSIMEKTTQTEFDSIVAHELEHIRRKDPALRLCYEFVSAIFWWVPTNWWKKKIVEDQEIACDQSVLKYGLDYDSLASSLIKVTKEAKMLNHEMFCFFSDKKSTSFIRLKAMMEFSAASPKIMTIGIAGVILEVLLFLACKI